jgi:hypothetical protein
MLLEVKEQRVVERERVDDLTSLLQHLAMV